MRKFIIGTDWWTDCDDAVALALAAKSAAMNLRCDDSFVQDDGRYAAAERYEDFLRLHRGLHVLFL